MQPWKRKALLWPGLLTALLTVSGVARAQPNDTPSRDRQDSLAPVDLGEEYPDYAKKSSRGSAHRGSDSSLFYKVVLYIPNRVLDLLDIFRVDVGAGPAYGAAVRLTDYGQAGARYMRPGSLRVGLFGRDWPVKWEEGSEYGVGPGFVRSRDRRVGHFEVGLSLDAFVGASAGIRIDEIADFVLGIFCIDFQEDDLS